MEKVANEIMAQSPFYREFHSDNKTSQFEKLKTSSKKDLLEDQRLFPPFGSNLSVDPRRIKRVHRTSGTTAKPYLIALTDNDLEAVYKSGAKAFSQCGVAPEDIVINCMNYNMWMGFSDHLSLEKAGAAVIPYGTGKTTELIELMLTLKGCCLHSTPSYLAIIKERLERDFKGITPKDLKIKKGFFGGSQECNLSLFANQ